MPNAVGRYLSKEVVEIAGDPALRRYGVAVASFHLLSFVWWRTTYAIAWLTPSATPICWPLVPFCESLRVLPRSGLVLALDLYCAVAAMAAACFAATWFTRRARLVLAGYVGLALLDAAKLAFLSLDYRLRLNEHTMAFFVSATFLFVPKKRDALRVLVVLFYLWAGTLKVNAEWVTGAALYRPLWLLHGPWVVAACVYVVVLELVVSPGLLARRAWLFWPCLAQFVLFHVMSWPVVGFFYPLLMGAVLSIFPLCRLASPAEPSPIEALVSGRMARPVYALAAGFSALQLVPRFFPGDPAVTGEGRLYALHMFDARMVCDGEVDLKGPTGTTRMDVTGRLPARIACDPIVFRATASRLCEKNAHRGSFTDLDATLRARRSTDTEMRTLVHVEDFCAKNVRYDPFWHNDWIETW